MEEFSFFASWYIISSSWLFVLVFGLLRLHTKLNWRSVFSLQHKDKNKSCFMHQCQKSRVYLDGAKDCIIKSCLFFNFQWMRGQGFDFWLQWWGVPPSIYNSGIYVERHCLMFFQINDVLFHSLLFIRGSAGCHHLQDRGQDAQPWFCLPGVWLPQSSCQCQEETSFR